MSRYIDADKLINTIKTAMKINRYNNYMTSSDYESACEFTIFWLEEYKTADVVSREQYNACYDECLRLREQNEQLRSRMEDDRK